jgi:hypothetical protein
MRFFRGSRPGGRAARINFQVVGMGAKKAGEEQKGNNREH